ncbi:YitT family protein [Halobacillus sp. Nhm2S1]|uniref:YczE/YyaS/YitT family protein n=1 Tax=Halobacillus sp. Nhm2S1 TaxID=2866716 RepID=UPI001C730725|nr:YitT family protein [Halobacillus sp. Nhm2S1]MBX0358822.1 YitT family protein [Halobacillus sp. Nhm2S1]
MTYLQRKNRENFIRWSFFFIGLVILGLGISMTMQVKEFGIGPWDVFHYGLFLKLGLTVGTWSIIAGLLIVLTSSVLQKRWPQVGTILNMVLIGVFIDFFNWLLPEPETLIMQLFIFISGTFVIALGIGVYVAPEIGAGPRDSLMLLITKATGWKVSSVRNGIEIIVAVLGFALGGPVGAGTVFIALFLGTFVGYTLPQAKTWLQFLIMKGDMYEDIYQRPLRANHHD